jgi:hypothetical protein
MGMNVGVEEKFDFIQPHWYESDVGSGFHPLTEAVRVWPTAVIPVIVGAGAERNGRPAATVEVGADERVFVTYPARTGLALTVKVLPTSEAVSL